MGRRALPQALRAAAERRPPRRPPAVRAVPLRRPVVARRAAAGARRAPAARSATPPLVTTMHQVVEPSTIDRGYTRLHRVAAPAVVARDGIAGVQSAISRAGAATIVHEEPFRRILPAATVIPHGIEDVAPIDARRGRAGSSALDDRFVVLCFGFLAPYKGIELVLDAAAPPAPRHPGRRRRRRAPADGRRRRASAPSCASATATSPGSPAGCPTATSPRGSAPPTCACSRTPSRSRRAACSPSPSPTARRCCCRRRWPAAPARRASLDVRR